MVQVREVMHPDPVVCTPHTSVENIKHLMKKYDYEEIVVVNTMEEKFPIGVIKGRDILSMEVGRDVVASELNAEHFMKVFPATIREDASIDECRFVMDTNHLARVAVTDDEGRCTGIVERGDV